MDFLQKHDPTLFTPGHGLDDQNFPPEMVRQFGSRVFGGVWPSDGEKSIGNSIRERTVLIGPDGQEVEEEAEAKFETEG